MCDGSEIKEDWIKVGLELHNSYRKAHGAEPMCIDAEVRTGERCVHKSIYSKTVIVQVQA